MALVDVTCRKTAINLFASGVDVLSFGAERELSSADVVHCRVI
jgi:hypothetical protein